MYMRILRGHPPQSLGTDEFIRKWEAFWPERMRAQPGFRHAHLGVDRATGAIATVSVFDDKPDDAVIERLSSEFRATLGTSGTPPPEATIYEVAAEV